MSSLVTIHYSLKNYYSVSTHKVKKLSSVELGILLPLFTLWICKKSIIEEVSLYFYSWVMIRAWKIIGQTDQVGTKWHKIAPTSLLHKMTKLCRRCMPAILYIACPGTWSRIVQLLIIKIKYSNFSPFWWWQTKP